MNTYEFRDPTRFGFTEYVGQNNLHAAAIGLLAIVVLVFVMGKRNYWFLVMGLAICNIPSSQRLILAGIDLNVLRLVGAIGFVVLLARGYIHTLKPALLDKIVVLSLLVPILMSSIRGQSSAAVTYMGIFADGVAIYFIGRVALRDLQSVTAFAWGLLIISIPIAIAMAIEKTTGRNFFSIFGGVPEFTPVRMGKLRAQGAFAHSIIAGCWFAASLPILVSQWKSSANLSTGKAIVVCGVPLAVVGVFATASSTPIAGACVVLGSFLIYPIRNYFMKVRLYALCAAVIIHFVSVSGIHHLLYTRFTFVTGSTGYHRYKLVDAAIERMPDWFLFGINSTYSWGYGLDDVTQEFVQAAVRGGIVGLTLLIAVLVLSFRNAGVLMRSRNPKESFVGYCLGVSVLVHAVDFLGASYFGQIQL
ncbi:MAG: hypothetical protein QMB94_10505, partial [Phycisphaerales bacterium]